MPRNGRFAAALATLAWFSVLLQCYLSLQLAVRNGKTVASGLATFFSYFTVLTNVLVCISLTVILIGGSSAAARFFSRPQFTAGLAANMAFVGLSYHFLLRNTWDPQGPALLADSLLHYAMPALYLGYWWFTRPSATLRWPHPLIWSAYPALYLAYALVRGNATGTYPYPFIDVAVIGYRDTIFNALRLLLAFLGLAYAFVALDRVRARPSA